MPEKKVREWRNSQIFLALNIIPLAIVILVFVIASQSGPASGGYGVLLLPALCMFPIFLGLALIFYIGEKTNIRLFRKGFGSGRPPPEGYESWDAYYKEKSAEKDNPAGG